MSCLCASHRYLVGISGDRILGKVDLWSVSAERLLGPIAPFIFFFITIYSISVVFVVWTLIIQLINVKMHNRNFIVPFGFQDVRFLEIVAGAFCLFSVGGGSHVTSPKKLQTMWAFKFHWNSSSSINGTKLEAPRGRQGFEKLDQMVMSIVLECRLLAIGSLQLQCRRRC